MDILRSTISCAICSDHFLMGCEMSEIHELYDRADQLKAEGKLEEAAATYQEILVEDANYALAHAALAVVQGRLGKHEEAVEHAQRVCQLEPHDPFSYTQLSVICQRAYAGTNNQDYIQKAEQAMAHSRTMQEHM